MLDTGIDVPEVVNLVLMKPVHSPIKLMQMIGRGTRCQEACHFMDRLPKEGKKEILIIDLWEKNFSKDAHEAPETSLPVLVSIFNTRLRLLETYLKEQSSAECQSLIVDLREQISRIPTDSFTIRRAMPDVEEPCIVEDGEFAIYEDEESQEDG